MDDDYMVSEFQENLLNNRELEVTIFNKSVDELQHIADDPNRIELAILHQWLGDQEVL